MFNENIANKAKSEAENAEEEAGTHNTGESSFFIHSCIHYLFIELIFCIQPLWRPCSLTGGRILIRDPSCCALKSMATFLAKAILPHASPSQFLRATREPRQCHSWRSHDYGQLSPWQNWCASLELHDCLRCSPQIFLLPSPLELGSYLPLGLTALPTSWLPHCLSWACPLTNFLHFHPALVSALLGTQTTQPQCAWHCHRKYQKHSSEQARWACDFPWNLCSYRKQIINT